MQERIGYTAGNIWDYLSQNGEATSNRLKTALKENDKAISLALGWLARENKIEFVKEGRSQLIRLKT
ncbi:MAG: hypothetical protein CSB33_05085 [Desulfobacterales bacterium]|nr:MAG: hypothetical protein CSB33_05085 [Desulfobacterales bacterium]